MYSEIEVVFNVNWVVSNPLLFKKQYNDFFVNHGDTFDVTSDCSKGYIVLRAKQRTACTRNSQCDR